MDDYFYRLRNLGITGPPGKHTPLKGEEVEELKELWGQYKEHQKKYSQQHPDIQSQYEATVEWNKLFAKVKNLYGRVLERHLKGLRKMNRRERLMGKQAAREFNEMFKKAAVGRPRPEGWAYYSHNGQKEYQRAGSFTGEVGPDKKARKYYTFYIELRPDAYAKLSVEDDLGEFSTISEVSDVKNPHMVIDEMVTQVEEIVSKLPEWEWMSHV